MTNVYGVGASMRRHINAAKRGNVEVALFRMGNVQTAIVHHLCDARHHRAAVAVADQNDTLVFLQYTVDLLGNVVSTKGVTVNGSSLLQDTMVLKTSRCMLRGSLALHKTSTF